MIITLMKLVIGSWKLTPRIQCFAPTTQLFPFCYWSFGCSPAMVDLLNFYSTIVLSRKCRWSCFINTHCLNSSCCGSGKVTYVGCVLSPKKKFEVTISHLPWEIAPTLRCRPQSFPHSDGAFKPFLSSQRIDDTSTIMIIKAPTPRGIPPPTWRWGESLHLPRQNGTSECSLVCVQVL